MLIILLQQYFQQKRKKKKKRQNWDAQQICLCKWDTILIIMGT